VGLKAKSNRIFLAEGHHHRGLEHHPGRQNERKDFLAEGHVSP
jgi:hypothetical protein